MKNKDWIIAIFLIVGWILVFLYPDNDKYLLVAIILFVAAIVILYRLRLKGQGKNAIDKLNDILDEMK